MVFSSSASTRMGDNMSKVSSSDEDLSTQISKLDAANRNCQIIDGNVPLHHNGEAQPAVNGVFEATAGATTTSRPALQAEDESSATRGSLQAQQDEEADHAVIDEVCPTVAERELPTTGVLLSEYHTLAPVGPESVGQDVIDPKDIVCVHESSDVATEKKPDLDFFGRPRPKSLVRKWPSMVMYLMSQANDDEWKDVVDRIRSHPHEIAIQGINGGMNSLHAACVRYPPLHVVEEIVKADPSVIVRRNFNGENPLHIATYSSSEEVQALLVRAAPQAAAMMDQYGDSPLHFSARAGATYNLMEAIVAAAPAMISQPNKRSITPFWMLPRTFLETDDLDEVLDVDGEDYRDDWDSLTLFLRYSYFPPGYISHTVRDEQGTPLPVRREDYTWVVHAAASTPSCPREVLKWLCRMFPEQALRLDHRGFTPLLCAVQQKELREPKDWNELEDGIREHVEIMDGELQNEDERLDDDEAALGAGDSAFLGRLFNRTGDNDDESKSDLEYVKESVVEVLLEWSPRSALHPDANGRLPLTHALLSGLSWKASIAKLIAACPRALECCDSISGLYNFQLAAMCSPQLDTVYTLVRSLPALLTYSNYGPNRDKHKAAPKAESLNSDAKMAATNEESKTQSEEDTGMPDASTRSGASKRSAHEQGDEFTPIDENSDCTAPPKKPRL